MKHYRNNEQSFIGLIDNFIKYLEELSYNQSTLINYKNTLIRIGAYMQENNIDIYSESIGKQYYDWYIKNHQIKYYRQTAIHTMIRRLNDYLNGGDYSFLSKPEVNLLPENFETILLRYRDMCFGKGNKKITVEKKLNFIRIFFYECILQELEDINTLKANHVEIACIKITNKDSWNTIREMLEFICVNGYCKYDFSILVPRYKKPILLPTTYSELEINRLENIIDKTKAIGKRDYLFLLLATRLGMRSGDIVNLRFLNLSLDNNTITFNQEKGGQLQTLPMIPIVRDAFDDYLNNSRPNISNDYIFIKCIAPFTPITTSVIRHQLTIYFKNAGINIKNKKHGPHTLRASLSTSMVNDNVPYEVVQKILGHSDFSSIKRYAKLDIDKLRDCAIEVPPPTSLFNEFLEGRFTL